MKINIAVNNTGMIFLGTSNSLICNEYYIGMRYLSYIKNIFCWKMKLVNNSVELRRKNKKMINYRRILDFLIKYGEKSIKILKNYQGMKRKK